MLRYCMFSGPFIRKGCLAIIKCPNICLGLWPNNQTSLAKHLKFAKHAMFEGFATSQLCSQTESLRNDFEGSKRFYAFVKQKKIDEKSFVMAKRSSIGLDKQISNTWKTMFDRLAKALEYFWLVREANFANWGSSQTIKHCLSNFGNLLVKQKVWKFGYVAKHC